MSDTRFDVFTGSGTIIGINAILVQNRLGLTSAVAVTEYCKQYLRPNQELYSHSTIKYIFFYQSDRIISGFENRDM